MRKVVYTVLTNGYDQLMQISCVKPDYDYICFSNDFDCAKVGMWTIRKIPFDTEDKQRLSRFPKLQPYRVLADYEFSIYIDANVDITTNAVYEAAEKFFSKGVSLAGLKHQLRDCIYRESLEVIIRGKEKNVSAVIAQMKKYAADGFPFCYGMYEANVIYRRHNDPVIVKQCDEWWFWQQNYSRRDQLSYSYSLWKYNIPFNYLLPPNEWARNSKNLVCRRHPQSGGFLRKIWIHIKGQQIHPFLIFVIFPFYKKFLKKNGANKSV